MNSLIPWICIIFILLPQSITQRATNDPEVLEQLWIQLYRYLPRPSTAPQLPSDLPLNVELSLTVESVELQHLGGQLVSQVSLLIFTEWPATDPRITDSRLLEVAKSAGISLDVEKVWHPELSFVGSYICRRLMRRLELRPGAEKRKLGELSGEMTGGTGSGSTVTSRAIDSSVSLLNPTGDSQNIDGLAKPILPVKRRSRLPAIKSGFTVEGMRFTLTERISLEVPCSQPKTFTHIGASVCPILIQNEGSTQAQVTMKWSDRKNCLISDEVNRRTVHVTTSKILVPHIDQHGPEQSLGIHLCFSQTTVVLQSASLPLMIVLLSLQLLWTDTASPNGWTCWIQVCLHLALVLIWSSLSGLHRTGGFGLVDSWCILCLIFISIATLCCQLQQRWVCRLLHHRRQRQQRFFADSLDPNSQAAHNNLPGSTTPGCLCTCKGENKCTAVPSGICPEADCIMHHCGLPGYNDDTTLNKHNGKNISVNEILFFNNFTGGCNSCATGSGGSRPTVTGRISASNHSHQNSGNNGSGNSPLPFHFKPTSQMCGSNLEAYGEGYLCSAGSESVTGGTFRGLRWHGDHKNPNAIGDNNTAANMHILCPNIYGNNCPNCVSRTQNMVPCGGLSVGHLTTNPGCSYTCKSLVQRKLPVNYAVHVVKVVVIILFFVIAAMFWIGVLVQGILPDICVGKTVCQSPAQEFV